MKIQRITIDPDPYEPFRLGQGYRAGDLLFISGQAAIGPDGELIGVGDFDAQAEQVFRNLEAVGATTGGSGQNAQSRTRPTAPLGAAARSARRAMVRCLHDPRATATPPHPPPRCRAASSSP